MKKKMYYYFYIFLISSVLGWLIEGIYTYLRRGAIINHSALVIGPFNIIYGICTCFLTTILFKYRKDSYIKLFLISFIGCSILEYILSYGMEITMGFTAWNYSRYFLNINGRICLLYSTYWGFLGILWIKWCYPFLIKLIDKINYKKGSFFMGFLLSFLILDTLLTFSAVNRAHKFEKGIEPQNKYELFLDKYFNVNYLKNMYNNHWK